MSKSLHRALKDYDQLCEEYNAFAKAIALIEEAQETHELEWHIAATVFISVGDKNFVKLSGDILKKHVSLEGLLHDIAQAKAKLQKKVETQEEAMDLCQRLINKLS